MKRLVFSGIAYAMLFLAAGSVSQAAPVGLSVVLGSDYLSSIPGGSSFPGLGTLNGVPYGGALGNTDTIVQRKSDAVFPGGSPPGTAPAIPIELTALQLVTVAPLDFGGNGIANYFVTLQSARGGPSSVGSMTITLGALDDGTAANPEGTFSSFFDVFFDIRKGSLGGPIVFSSDLVLTNSSSPWDATPTPGTVILTAPVGSQNANLHTGKAVGQMDFFPLGPFSETHPNGAVHAVQGANGNTSQIPEPGTSLLIGAGLLGLAALWKRKRR
jgi:hypothetical protein